MSQYHVGPGDQGVGSSGSYRRCGVKELLLARRMSKNNLILGANVVRERIYEMA